jgi:surfeit locus 1 family protein
MSATLRGLLWPAVAASLASLLLMGLGIWQLQRLAWKEALIERIESRAQLAPVDLPPRAEWPSLASEDYDFRHVRMSGRFDLHHEALLFSTSPAGFGPEPGYYVLAPFDLEGGGVIFVNRGFIAASKARDAARRSPPETPQTITGLMRPPQTRNLFTPADDPDHGMWYTSDPQKIAQSRGIAGAAPFTVVLDPPGEDARDATGEFPRPAASGMDIVNNHLSYAVTWFGLAAALIVVFLAYARSSLQSLDKRAS